MYIRSTVPNPLNRRHACDVGMMYIEDPPYFGSASYCLAVHPSSNLVGVAGGLEPILGATGLGCTLDWIPFHHLCTMSN